MLFQKEKGLRAAAEEKLQDLEVKYRMAEDNLEKTRQQADDLRQQLGVAEEQMASIKQELDNELANRDRTMAEMEQIRQELESNRQLKDDLDRQLGEARSQIDGFTQQIKNLEDEKARLQEQVNQQQSVSGIELGKIVVASPTGEPQQQPPAEGEPAPAAGDNMPPSAGETGNSGKVLVVNREYNFVVIDLGVEDGIKAGEVLSLYRDNRLLGDIKIEKVHESMSAANMLSEGMKDRVKEGDTAVRKQ
ncbi:MAG: hypothetical protein PHR44_04450 [Candidatus Omnitrophica bacterium]|nr:hypothetical protein [Candidatus Omnitrophota bacterium]